MCFLKKILTLAIVQYFVSLFPSPNVTEKNVQINYKFNRKVNNTCEWLKWYHKYIILNVNKEKKEITYSYAFVLILLNFFSLSLRVM